MSVCMMEKHSLYISRFPVGNDGLPYVPNDYEYKDYLTKEGLIYLCSDTMMNYEIDYPMATYVPPTGVSDDTIIVDQMMGSIGRISISGDRVGSDETGSNRWFDKELETMIADWQIQKNAYLLRFYNMIGTNVEGKEAVRDGEAVDYMDIFVYINEYSGTVAQPPNTMSIHLKLTQRNMLLGLQESNVDTIFPYGDVI